MGLLQNLFRQNNHAQVLEPQVLRLLIKRLAGRKSCIIEIRNDQSITELDFAIRRTLNYDTWDHCSAFFAGAPWESPCLVEVYPDNSAQGQLEPISKLQLIPGIEFGYVYDFGDNLQHLIAVEAVLPVDTAKQYPETVLVSKKTSATQKKNDAKDRRKND